MSIDKWISYLNLATKLKTFLGLAVWSVQYLEKMQYFNANVIYLLGINIE